MLISRYWSPAPKAIEEKHKQLLPVCPKTALGRKKRKAISKLFVLHANAMNTNSKQKTNICLKKNRTQNVSLNDKRKY